MSVEAAVVVVAAAASAVAVVWATDIKDRLCDFALLIFFSVLLLLLWLLFAFIS